MFKRFIAFALVFFIIIELFPLQVNNTYADDEYTNYTGQTAKGKYLITTTEQFELLKNNSTSANDYYSGSEFKLGNNIDFQSTEPSKTNCFKGVFNGDNYSIKNYIGTIFNKIENGVIKNVVFDNPVARISVYKNNNKRYDVYEHYSPVNELYSSYMLNCHVINVNLKTIMNDSGLLVNKAYSKSVIDGCSAKGNVTLKAQVSKDIDEYPESCMSRVSAIANINSQSTIQNCTNYVNISGYSSYLIGNESILKANCPYRYNYVVGGIVNMTYADSKVYNCNNYGRISVGNLDCGGIVGCMRNNAEIYGCNNYGNIGGLSSHIITVEGRQVFEYDGQSNTYKGGGICGIVCYSSGESTIKHCKNYGICNAGIALKCYFFNKLTISECINYGFCEVGFVEIANCDPCYRNDNVSSDYNELNFTSCANKGNCAHGAFLKDVSDGINSSTNYLKIKFTNDYNSGLIDTYLYVKHDENDYSNYKPVVKIGAGGGTFVLDKYDAGIITTHVYNSGDKQYKLSEFFYNVNDNVFSYSNTYYNDFNKPNSYYIQWKTDPYNDAMRKSPEEMKSRDFVDLMGNAFAFDSTNMNDGFPVLKYELIDSIDIIGDTELYKGMTSTFSAATKPGTVTGLSYAWTIGDSNIATLTNANSSAVIVKGKEKGSTVLTCTVTYGGFIFMKSVTLTIIDPKFTTGDITIVGSNSLDTGKVTLIQSNYTTGIDTSKITYTWSTNSYLSIVGISNTQNITVKGIRAGLGVVTLKANYNGAEVTKTFTITVSNPFSSAKVSILGDNSMYTLTSITLTANSNKSIIESDVIYTWTSSDTSILSIETGTNSKSATIKGLKKGTTTVNLSMSYYGVIKTATISVTVTNPVLNTYDISLVGSSTVSVDDITPVVVKLPVNINESLVSYTWNISNTSLASYTTAMNGKSVLLRGIKAGNFVLTMNLKYDDKTYTKTMNISVIDLTDEIKPNYFLVGEKLNYLYNYSDPENDAVYTEEFMYTHNTTYLSDNIKLDNNLGVMDNNNVWLPNFTSMFMKPGTFNLNMRVKDYPETTKNGAFESFRRYSNTISTTIYIHRKPVADFTISSNNITDNSYDLDHNITMTNKGIKKWKWIYVDELGNTQTYTVTDKSTGESSINSCISTYKANAYEIFLKVQDIEGVWSNILSKKANGTGGEESTPPEITEPNNPPVIDFNILTNESPVWTFPRIIEKSTIIFRPLNTYFNEEKVKFVSTVHDPDTTNQGFTYSWKIERYLVQNISNISGTPANTYTSTSSVPSVNTFKSSYGWGAYRITYTVMDKPPIPPYVETDKKTATLTKEYYIVPEINISSSCTCSDLQIKVGSTVILSAETNEYVTGVMAEFEGNNLNLNKVSSSGGKVKWQLNYVIPDILPRTGMYDVKFVAFTNYGGNGYNTRKAESTNQIYILVNNPPKVENISVVTDISDKYVYEGDNTDVIIKVDDEDFNTLDIAINLYNKLDLTNKIIPTINKTITPVGGIYSDLRCDLMNIMKIGNYRVVVTVTDTFGETDTLYYDFAVNDLWIHASVNHTEKWEENRLFYNTKYPSKARASDVYWSGEAFETTAETTVINSNSSIMCTRVSVEIINADKPWDSNYLDWLSAYNSTGDKWKLYYARTEWNNKWGNVAAQQLIIRFKAYFSNNWVESDDVIIIINNIEPFWELHRKW